MRLTHHYNNYAMGCNTGCLSGNKPTYRRSTKRSDNRVNAGTSTADDTIVSGVCLRTANAGHYFAETELLEVKEKQLKQRMQKWLNMCLHHPLPDSIV